jgi:hypothetical protein
MIFNNDRSRIRLADVVYEIPAAQVVAVVSKSTARK